MENIANWRCEGRLEKSRTLKAANVVIPQNSTGRETSPMAPAGLEELCLTAK
jgi:hypothetical protein